MMWSMKPLDMMGGAFELELPVHDNFPHQQCGACAYVNSGRSALQVILQNLPKPRRVLVPRFICDTVLQPLRRLRLRVERYGCDDQLRPQLPYDLTEDDTLILVNYFGLTGEAVDDAARQHKGVSIVDATTALFAHSVLPSFYSPRKFCGVADGGVACAPCPLSILPLEEDMSFMRSMHMLIRVESGAFVAKSACEVAEQELKCPPKIMSPLTRRLLRAYDFDKIAERRRENYAVLHRLLGGINRLELPAVPRSAPFCYPLVSGIPGLRDELVEARIALPLFWPEVIEATGAETAENRLARTLLPLPLDQRYTPEDMEDLAKLILH